MTINKPLALALLSLQLITPLNAQTLTGASLLGKIQKDSIRYFFKYSNEKTGLTADSSESKAPASIAATGYHILALLIAGEKKLISKREVYQRIKLILTTVKKKAEHEHGFFYHFISHNSGKRVWASEASSIDTALFIANALLAGQVYKGTRIEQLANEIYDRVDWAWMTNNTNMFSHGYKPESGFLPYYWDIYSEHLILQALGIGARRNPSPPEVWSHWQRLHDEYNDHNVIYAASGSLFTYQYSHMFIDFRELYDLEINYFDNSVAATKANQDFAQAHATDFETYAAGLWGLSASLGPRGYKAYGARPGMGFHDGTIAPYSVVSSLIFTPEESLKTLEHLYNEYNTQSYGNYGFRGAINPHEKWFAKSYIGIDQGVTIGMIENHQNEFIWKHFMKIPAIQRWIELCNLKQQNPAVQISSVPE